MVTRRRYGIYVVVAQTSFSQGNKWWRREMSAIFSGYQVPRISYFRSAEKEKLKYIFKRKQRALSNLNMKKM